MTIAELKKFAWHKYGLLLTKDSKGHFSLAIDHRHQPFAFVDANGRLTIKCPAFACVIDGIPGCQRSLAMQHHLGERDWLELKMTEVKDFVIKLVLKYAFIQAINGHCQLQPTQLTYLPGDDEAKSPYQAQTIPTRKVFKDSQPQVPVPLIKMIKAYDYSITPADIEGENFYRQGQMVADYEDDYDSINEMRAYYPSYHRMTVPQMRTYFAWRTRLRHHDFTVSSTSYAYVYLYELLNNIGVKDPVGGFHQLQFFDQHYADNYGQGMHHYIHRWLKDYVLYYGLDHQAADQAFAKENAIDQQYHVILHPRDYSPDQLMEALSQRCTYLQRCRLGKSSPKQWGQLVQAVWQRVIADDAKWIGRLIGRRKRHHRYYFQEANFYYRLQPPVPEYVLNPERTIHCHRREYIYSEWTNPSRQTVHLNTLFHEVDRLTRQKLQLGHPLKPRSANEHLLKLIQAGIDDFLHARQEAARPKVTIHRGQLDQIRADASQTRESLLTEAEKKETEQSTAPQLKSTPLTNPTLPPSADSSTPMDDDSVDEDEDEIADELPQLTADEQYLLVALLTGQPYHDYLKQHHLMASILVDSINDKLMDLFGDTVIDFDDSGKPTVIDDYRDDCLQMYGPKEK